MFTSDRCRYSNSDGGSSGDAGPTDDGLVKVEAGEQSSRRKLRHAPEVEKVCRVCGDKALNVNFNVVTCESCKAFFRRNALKKKELHCTTSGSCEISVRSRRTCKKCRLDKCFQVGMVKEWIMSDEERQSMRQLIQQNREKRRLVAIGMEDDGQRSSISEKSATTTDCPSSASSSKKTSLPSASRWPPSSTPFARYFQPAPTSLVSSLSSTSNTSTSTVRCTALPTRRTNSPASRPVVPGRVEEMVRVPKTLLAALIDQCHKTGLLCPHNGKNSHPRPSVIVPRSGSALWCICQCRCGSNVCELKKEEACGEQTEQEDPPEADQLSSDHHNQLALVNSGNTSEDFLFNFNFGLSGAKLFHLTDLLSAFNYPQRLVGRGKDETRLMPALPPITFASAGTECIRRIDGIVRRLVRFCGKVAGSSSLKRKVLASLVKGSCSQLLLLHSLLSYSPSSDAWYDSGPNIRPISAGNLKKLKGGVHEGHTEFIKSFPAACKDDVSIVLIVFAIVFLNPALVGANEKEEVQRVRDFYVELLLQYLDSKFEPDKARRLRDSVLRYIETGIAVASRLAPTIVVELNERNMEPLLVEILGFK